MRHGLHHLHIRQRIHQRYQKYPHPDPKIRWLDNIVYVVSVILPLTALPQIYQIWSTQDAQGVSLLTWGLFAVFSVPMLLYGIVHKVKPLIIMNILWMLVYAGIISGIILYG
jgi:uncharacterized protein with PQ loop repeat